MTYQDSIDQALPFDDKLLSRRQHVVRFCLRFCYDPDIAEDLAQETLIEAWRHSGGLREPEAVTAWLYGIARNVCLRWLRREGRERARRVEPVMVDEQVEDWTQNIADEFDVEVELERNELAILLDRALALLPLETRSVLVQKYVEESPHATIAKRLGLSEGAVAMRVQRGKLALKHVLQTDLRSEATAFGVVDERVPEWQTTRLWCPLCGQSQLRALPASSDAGFTLECPACSDTPGGMLIQSSMRPLFANMTSIKASYSRIRAWSSQYSEQALVSGIAACIQCGALAPLRQGIPAYAPEWHRQTRALQVWCERCQSGWWSSLNGLTIHLAAVHQFWNEHQRIRLLPPREILRSAKLLLVTRVESLRDSTYLDVVHDAESLALHEIHNGNKG